MSRVILTDIEGTTSAIDFVHRVLFPYSRARLPDFVRDNLDREDVRAAVDAVLTETGADGEEAAISTLLHWIDIDRKATPLKTLQGMIWRVGYERADFTAHLYIDAFDQMHAWRQRNVPMYVYSSGSIDAQKQFFRYSVFGDLSAWFRGHYDTTSGGKREVDSYRRIAADIGSAPGAILFLSDIEAELDAAAAAGLATTQLLRPDTRPESNGRHPTVASFRDVEP